MAIINRIGDLGPEMAAWRQHLHTIPELSFDCPKTSAFIRERLEEIGVDAIHDGIAQTGIVAIIQGKGDGPTIGLRADFLIVTDIREFQAIVPQDDPDAPLRVDVRLNIKLIDAFEDRIIASRSFEEVVPALSDAPRDVVEAFDEALGDTMRDSVEWSIREIKRYAG